MELAIYFVGAFLCTFWLAFLVWKLAYAKGVEDGKEAEWQYSKPLQTNFSTREQGLLDSCAHGYTTRCPYSTCTRAWTN